MFLHYRKKNPAQPPVSIRACTSRFAKQQKRAPNSVQIYGCQMGFQIEVHGFFSTVKKYSAPYFFGRKFIPPHIFTDDIGGIGGYISPPPPPPHTHTHTQTYTPQLCSIYFFTIVFLSTFCYMILEGVEKCTFLANVFGYHLIFIRFLWRFQI